MDINLKNVRISYPHLFEPFTSPDGGKPKFSGRFLLNKETHATLIKEVQDAIRAMAKTGYKDGKIPPADKLCLRDGDQSGRDEEVGCWTLNASDDKRPVVVNADRSALTAEDDVIYPGCRVNARIRLWVQDNKYGRRINANLLGVQFAGDADRLGNGVSRPKVDEMFEEVSDFAGNGDDDSPF